ncbi:MAG TPA: NUDIX hydrolase [Reyranella sp.]|nr:NUDIX hydrolase [Reyranella sp.]
MSKFTSAIPSPWSLVEDQVAFDCPYFRIRSDRVKDGAGAPRHYYSVRMKNFGIAVLPIDSDGNTVLVGQQRYVLGRFTWEVIRGGGRIDMPALESAKNELSEEAGFLAGNWLQLFEASASPGVTDELSDGFIAWNLRAGAPHPEAHEELVRWRVPFSQAVTMALSGEIADLASLALILGTQTKLQRGELPADLAECVRRS